MLSSQGPIPALIALLLTAVGCGGMNDPVLPLQARIVETTPTSVSIAWDSFPRATHYRVRRDNTTIWASSESATGYFDNFLDAGRTYEYRVTAYRWTGPVGEERIGDSEVMIATTPPAADWSRERISEYRHVSNLVVDSEDVAQFLWCGLGADLHHMRDTVDGWDKVPLADGCRSHVVIGPDDRLHAVFRDDGGVYYGREEAHGWVAEAIESDTYWRADLDLVVREDGAVHLAYVSSAFGLRHATNETGSWVIHAVDPGPDVERLALAAGDHVHLLYYREGVLLDWTDASGDWSIETAGLAREYGLESAGGIGAAVDRQGVLHAVTYGEGTIEYYARRATGWSQETLESHRGHRGDVSLAIGPAGAVHVSYNTLWGDLKYANNAAGHWRTVFVAVDGDVGEHNSLAIDSTGLVHILYLDYTTDALWRVRGRMP